MEPAEVRLPYNMGRETWALAVVGCGVREGLDGKSQGVATATPYRFRICGCIGRMDQGP